MSAARVKGLVRSAAQRFGFDLVRTEPKLALVGGTTGLEVTARLITQAAEHLKPGGWLVLEIHSGLEAQVHALLTKDGRFTKISTIKDLAQLPRVVQTQRAS